MVMGTGCMNPLPERNDGKGRKAVRCGEATEHPSDVVPQVRARVLEKRVAVCRTIKGNVS